MAHEILTLQFGHYSNYIGTHWWNLQESSFQYDPSATPSEINHDTLFRQGLTHNKQITFTPRLLLVDLKGSLLTLPQTGGELYALPDEEAPDFSQFEVRQEEQIEKIPFQQDLAAAGQATTTKKIYNLEQDVRVWSDFLYTRFHPRTINTVKSFQYKNSLTPFDSFPLGQDLWKTTEFSEDFTDKIRNYIEECDNFGGFHTIFDGIDGFAGLSVSCLEYIRDEYDTKPILAFPTVPYTDSIENGEICLVNYILSLHGLAEHSSLTIPLSTLGPWQFDNVKYNPLSAYHSSAVLATFLETFSLAYRLKDTGSDLGDFTRGLSPNGRKFAAASLSFPFPLASNEFLLEFLDNFDTEKQLTASLTPNCAITQENSFQHYTLRGIAEKQLKSSSSQKQRKMPAFQCETIEEMLKMYLNFTGNHTQSHITACSEKIKVSPPFPDIVKTLKTDNDEVSALAGVHNGVFVSEMLTELLQRIEKIKLKRHSQFSCLEIDDFKECVERVFELRDCYHDNYLL